MLLFERPQYLGAEDSHARRDTAFERRKNLQVEGFPELGSLQFAKSIQRFVCRDYVKPGLNATRAVSVVPTEPHIKEGVVNDILSLMSAEQLRNALHQTRRIAAVRTHEEAIKRVGGNDADVA